MLYATIYISLLFILTNLNFEVNMNYELILIDVFIYLGFYVAFNTVQVISRRVVGRAEETST